MKHRSSKIFMPEGYCVKCKEETMKNGRKAIKGKCPTCGTVMFKILGGKATAPVAAPAPAIPAPATPTPEKPPAAK
jgi:ribosomal protein S27E